MSTTHKSTIKVGAFAPTFLQGRYRVVFFLFFSNDFEHFGTVFVIYKVNKIV